ncbi:MAG: endonuclease domain-containing protein [Minwuia sp.]|uniref:endonuclease domain-containing protein n=1 Tax=Minwuia sp. TaxID=2493630 RepID=UPI003A8C7B93
MPAISGAIGRARKLRGNATDAERRLWRQLRNRQRSGVRFRRQHPIGPYIADFCCLEAKLVIELDGGQHAAQAVRDEARTRWLASVGYRVIRFWNNQVNENLEGVISEIDSALDGAEP